MQYSLVIIQRRLVALLTVPGVGTLIVDLHDNWGAHMFTVAGIDVGLRQQVPALAASSSYTVHNGFTGHVSLRVDGCSPNSLDSGGGWPACHCWTAVVVPCERSILNTAHVRGASQLPFLTAEGRCECSCKKKSDD